MRLSKKLGGIALATAAAGAFAMASMAAHADDKASSMVRCEGVNACKGHGSCKTADNACKGHNSCKGKSFVEMSKAACEQIDGRVGEK